MLGPPEPSRLRRHPRPPRDRHRRVGHGHGLPPFPPFRRFDCVPCVRPRRARRGTDPARAQARSRGDVRRPGSAWTMSASGPADGAIAPSRPTALRVEMPQLMHFPWPGHHGRGDGPSARLMRLVHQSHLDCADTTSAVLHPAGPDPVVMKPLAPGLTTGPPGRDRFGRAEPVASTSLFPDRHPAMPDPVVMKPRLHDVVTWHRGTADSVWRRLSATMSFRSDRRWSTCPLMDTWARRGRRRQGETGCTLPARFGCCWPLPPLEMFHPGVASGGVRRGYQRRQASAGASMSSTASSRGTSAPSCSMCCSSAPSATSRSRSSVSAPATAISYGAVRFSSQCLRW